MEQIIITIQDENNIPICEKYLNNMFILTFLPAIRHKNNIVKYTIPILCILILFISIFSLLWYPNYYATQKEIWTADIIIGLIVYLYMLYLHNNWNLTECYEDTKIQTWKNIISIGFYVFFILYWFYYAIVQFMTHNENKYQIQLGNTFMSISWYIFFSLMATLYYFICTRLTQRAQNIKDFIKSLKKNRPSIEQFFIEYNKHHKKIKNFSKYWNFMIFFGFLLLTFHVPIDIISIVYNQYYYDIPGFIIKFAALLWYTYCICYLNNYSDKIIPYLYKHKIFECNKIDEIEKYIVNRQIGLNFYGIKITGNSIIKIGLIVLNLVIPTIYALFSNKIIGI